MTLDPLRKILALMAAVESATAIVALAAPALLVRLLLGIEADATVGALTRCFGIALLALAAAWWPRRATAEVPAGAIRSVLIYNALIALFLAYLGAAERMAGLLLWPAVVVHALVALLLVAAWRRRPPADTSR